MFHPTHGIYLAMATMDIHGVIIIFIVSGAYSYGEGDNGYY